MSDGKRFTVLFFLFFAPFVIMSPEWVASLQAIAVIRFYKYVYCGHEPCYVRYVRNAALSVLQRYNEMWLRSCPGLFGYARFFSFCKKNKGRLADKKAP